MKNDKLDKIRNANTDLTSLKLSRRELLEAGLISCVTRIAVPGAVTSILSMSEKANAQAESGSMMPVITLSLSGGAALHGNFVVKDKGGSHLPSYNKLGLGKAGFATERIMGADFASSSSLHKGIKSIAFSDTINKTRLVALCTNTAADTNAVSANRPLFDLSGPLERAGLVGKLLPVIHQGAGAENLRPVFSAPSSTLEVGSLDNMFGALGYSSTLARTDILNASQKNSLSSFIGKMTKAQIAKLNSKDDGLKLALEEVGIKSADILKVGGAKSVDPRLNEHVRTVYGLATNTAVSDAKAVTAGVVYNALQGNISHGRVTLGGYDYHITTPGGRTVSDQRDFAAGQQIGRMLELANKMKKSLFIVVVTDGACISEVSDSATEVWAGDYTTSLQFVIAFDPNGKITSSGNQIGHYLTDQSVDTSTLVGSRPDYVAATILANYLNINRKMGLFKQLAPATLQADDLAKVVKFHAG